MRQSHARVGPNCPPVPRFNASSHAMVGMQCGKDGFRAWRKGRLPLGRFIRAETVSTHLLCRTDDRRRLIGNELSYNMTFRMNISSGLGRFLPLSPSWRKEREVADELSHLSVLMIMMIFTHPDTKLMVSPTTYGQMMPGTILVYRVLCPRCLPSNCHLQFLLL